MTCSLEVMQGSEDVIRPACSSVGLGLMSSLRSLVGMLEEVHGLTLAIPPTITSKSDCRTLKKFCGDLLEGDRNHPWRRSISRRPLRQRMSIAMSLFLFRKCIPSPKPSCDQYVERMSRDCPLPDGRFLEFVQQEVPKMFRPGWDREYYPNAALNSVLPVKSCVQRGMGSGGARLEVLTRQERWNTRTDFLLRALSEECRSTLLPSRVTAVETGGKWRIVSVGDVEMNILRPLHTAIYNRISQFKWLLRGEATPSKFKDFQSREGCVFVSGDYESATDNLNLWVQKLILSKILRSARSVPEHVKELAKDSQELDIYAPGGDPARVRTGQLMGNLLSFPLLCIVNYLAFRYYAGVGPEVPVRINGDDIVFRSSRQVADRWMRGVVGSGLTLSRGKTLVKPQYFTLNSRLFRGKRSGPPELVPCVRSTAFGFGKLDDGVAGLAGRWRRVRKDYPCSKRVLLILETWFLRVNVRYVVRSRRSLTRGLDCKFSYDAIARNNLWRREVWYLSLEKEFPMPAKPALLDQLRIPEGWELRRVENITKEMRMRSREAGPAFIECAWSPAALTGRERVARFEEAKELAPRYDSLARVVSTKRARLLKLSRANTRRFLRPGLLRDGGPGVGWVWVRDPWKILKISRPVGKKIWLPAEACPRPTVKEEDIERTELQGAVPCIPSNLTFLRRDGTLARVQILGEGVVMEPPPSYYRTLYSQCRPPTSLCGGGYVGDPSCVANSRKSLMLGAF
jgi:hypothetical protein